MQNHVQQGPMDFNVAIVINKTQFPKLVHESADAGSRRTDHVRERLLADFRQDRFGLPFLAKIGKKQEGSRQALLARIEQLIDQVRLDTAIASHEVRDE